MNTNNNFDAFDSDAIMPEPQDSSWFGEFVILRGFQAIAIKGSGIEEYDSQNPNHQNAIHQGKRVSVAYEYQLYPINATFETYPRTVFKWSKDWRTILESLSDLWNLDPNNHDQATKIGNKLRDFTKGGQYARWENVIVRKYKNSTGEEKSVYAPKFLALYGSRKECQDEYDKAKGIDGPPNIITEKKVDALPLNQALAFADTLIKQCIVPNRGVDINALENMLKEHAMLANLNVHSDEMQQKIKAVNDELPF